MAEALGLFFLVFVGGSAICMNDWMSGGYGLLGIALAHGLALMVAVYMTGYISGGHINPAVSIGLLIIGKINAGRAGVYLLMQLIGAVAGGLAVWGMFPDAPESLHLGTPLYDEGTMSMIKVIGVEALLTFLLMSSVLLTAVDSSRSAKQMSGLCIGLTLTFCILIGGPYTGAALNPARYFGTAAVSGDLTQIVPYFVGPILGAVVASGFYSIFLATKEEAASQA